MKVLASIQNKGGVGKTTSIKLMAEYFAKRSPKRVLLIDLDAQCNLSKRFVDMELNQKNTGFGATPPIHPEYDPDEDGDWSGKSSSADIYFDGEVFPYQTCFDSTDIIPGDALKLKEVELVQKNEVAEKVHSRLKQFLNLEEVRASYDLVLIDTPPSKGPLTISAVRAATHIIIPTVMETQCAEGLEEMLLLWRQEIPYSEQLDIIGIMVNQYKKCALHRDIMATLKNQEALSEYVLDQYLLGERIAFAETDHPSAVPKSVFDLSPKDKARIEAERLCNYIDEQLFGDSIMANVPSQVSTAESNYAY